MKFEEVYSNYKSYVMKTLSSNGVRSADLEDQSQEVFLQVLNKYDTYDHSRPIKPWLYTFILGVASHYRRRYYKSFLLFNDDSDSENNVIIQDSIFEPDNLLNTKELHLILEEILKEIDPSRVTVFIECEINQRPYKEVAEELDIPIGTVYSRLWLARKDFQRAIKRFNARIDYKKG